MAFAKIYNVGGTDKTLILNVRTGLLQGFQATNWTDLRFGWLLSITQAGADNTITLLTESIGANPPPRIELGWVDRVAIGLTDKANQNVFLGYTNASGPRQSPSPGNSRIVSSDGAIGTANTNFWRFKNGDNDNWVAGIYDTGFRKATSQDGVQPHFAQIAANAGGYATLLAIRYRRDTPRSTVIRMEIKQGTHSSDILFTNTPTSDILLANLQAFPGTVQQIGPVELSVEPDAVFMYWPFSLSRLRVHAMGFLKAG